MVDKSIARNHFYIEEITKPWNQRELIVQKLSKCQSQ